MRHDPPGFPRQDERYGVRFRANVQRSDGNQVTVLVTDCSAHGCLLTGEDFVAGEIVTIDIPGSGQFNAEIRWSKPGKRELTSTMLNAPDKVANVSSNQLTKVRSRGIAASQLN